MTIESKVLEENAIMHDSIAEHHNLNVPYINRKSTKLFYENLILQYFGDLNEVKKPIKVLEIGCGTGTFVDFSISNNFQYVGIDLSQKMVELAKKNHHENKGKRFYCNDLKSYSNNANESFDLIVSSSFLHHLHDLDDGIQDIKKLLNKSGMYIGLHEPIVPHKQSFLNKVDTIIAIISGAYFGQFNLFIRMILILSGYFNVDQMGERKNWLDVFKFYSFLKSGNDFRGVEHSRINYVDYQLNNDFNLSTRVFPNYEGFTARVDNYNFSVFGFTRKFDKSNQNYSAFILKKLID